MKLKGEMVGRVGFESVNRGSVPSLTDRPRIIRELLRARLVRGLKQIEYEN